MKKIFLAGGGDEKASIDLDKKFVSLLDPTKTLIYIPNAMQEKKYKACLRWFTSVFTPLGVKNIRMLNTMDGNLNLKTVSGIYLGGGDANKLLKEIYNSSFDNTLQEAIKMDKPIYGGSAGAIVLGKDVRSAPEAREKKAEESRGLNLIFGYSVYCHYNKSSDDIFSVKKMLSCPIVAIPENSGIYVEENVLQVIGAAPILVSWQNKQKIIEPGNKFSP